MIYDTFIFLNEFDILEIRLRELWDVVDKFVLIEGTKTFRGSCKPLHFHENRGRFVQWSEKIVHYVVDDMPDGGDPWAREWHSREATKRAISPGARDVILVSDVDEIPKARVVSRYRPCMGMVALQMPDHWFRLTLKRKDLYNARPKLLRGSEFTARSLYDIRYFDCEANGLVLFDAGWHFTYMGGIDQIDYKVRSFSHWNEPTAETTLTNFRKFTPEGAFGKERVEEVPLIVLPQCVRDNPEEWRKRGLL